MLPEKNYNYLIEVLQVQYDANMASLLYFEHQLSLPDNYRMDKQFDEDYVNAQIIILKASIDITKETIELIKKSQGTPKPRFHA